MTKPLPKHPLAVAALSAAITGLVLATAAWTPRPNPFRAASPTLRAIGGPQLLNGNPAPRYPDQMRATNEEGVVVAAFVTDKSGAPDTVSVSIVQTTNEAFASSVKAVLPRLRYSGPGAVVFTCRFQITARDHRRDPSYVSPQYVSGVDTTRQIVVTGVSPSP